MTAEEGRWDYTEDDNDQQKTYDYDPDELEKARQRMNAEKDVLDKEEDLFTGDTKPLEHQKGGEDAVGNDWKEGDDFKSTKWYDPEDPATQGSRKKEAGSYNYDVRAGEEDEGWGNPEDTAKDIYDLGHPEKSEEQVDEENKCENCERAEDFLNDDGLCEDCEREAGIDRMESMRDAYEGYWRNSNPFDLTSELEYVEGEPPITPGPKPKDEKDAEEGGVGSGRKPEGSKSALLPEQTARAQITPHYDPFRATPQSQRIQTDPALSRMTEEAPDDIDPIFGKEEVTDDSDIALLSQLFNNEMEEQEKGEDETEDIAIISHLIGEEDFKEGEHPRGGDSEHPGRFSAGSGGTSGGTDKPKEKKFTMKQYTRNEDVNNHGKNARLLVKQYGTPEELEEIDSILKRNPEGYSGADGHADYERRYEISNKYYKNLQEDSEKPKETTKEPKRKLLTNRSGDAWKIDVPMEPQHRQNLINDVRERINRLQNDKDEKTARKKIDKVEDMSDEQLSKYFMWMGGKPVFTASEVDLNTMNQAHVWWDNKFPDRPWSDMRIGDRQRAILAFLRDPDTVITVESKATEAQKAGYIGCPHCNQEFSNVQYLKDHIDEQHEGKETHARETDRDCDECGGDGYWDVPDRNSEDGLRQVPCEKCDDHDQYDTYDESTATEEQINADTWYHDYSEYWKKGSDYVRSGLALQANILPDWANSEWDDLPADIQAKIKDAGYVTSYETYDKMSWEYLPITLKEKLGEGFTPVNESIWSTSTKKQRREILKEVEPYGTEAKCPKCGDTYSADTMVDHLIDDHKAKEYDFMKGTRWGEEEIFGMEQIGRDPEAKLDDDRDWLESHGIIGPEDKMEQHHIDYYKKSTGEEEDETAYDDMKYKKDTLDKLEPWSLGERPEQGFDYQKGGEDVSVSGPPANTQPPANMFDDEEDESPAGEGMWLDDDSTVNSPTISDIPDMAKSMARGYYNKLKRSLQETPQWEKDLDDLSEVIAIGESKKKAIGESKKKAIESVTSWWGGIGDSEFRMEALKKINADLDLSFNDYWELSEEIQDELFIIYSEGFVGAEEANTEHEPAGSSTGGQFTSKDGGDSGGKLSSTSDKDLIKSIKGGSKDWHDWGRNEKTEDAYAEIERRNKEIPTPKLKGGDKIFRDDPDAVGKMEKKIKYWEEQQDYWKQITKFPNRDYQNRNQLGDARWFMLTSVGTNLREAKKKLEGIKSQQGRGTDLVRKPTYKDGKKRFYYSEEPKGEPAEEPWQKGGESYQYIVDILKKKSSVEQSPNALMRYTEPIDLPTGKNALDQTYGVSEPETPDGQDLTGITIGEEAPVDDQGYPYHDYNEPENWEEYEKYLDEENISYGDEEIIEKKFTPPKILYYKQYPFGRRAGKQNPFGESYAEELDVDSSNIRGLLDLFGDMNSYIDSNPSGVTVDELKNKFGSGEEFEFNLDDLINGGYAYREGNLIKSSKPKELYEAKEFESPIRDQHGNPYPTPEGIADCTFCGKVFDNWDVLGDHITIVHNDQGRTRDFYGGNAPQSILNHPDWTGYAGEGGQGSGRKQYKSEDPKSKDKAHIGWKNYGIDDYIDKAEQDYLAKEQLEDPTPWVSLAHLGATTVKDILFPEKSDEFWWNKKRRKLTPEELEISKTTFKPKSKLEDILKQRERERGGEGGSGSGKKDHKSWMRAIEEEHTYDFCENCNMITEQVNHKCDMCGKRVE